MAMAVVCAAECSSVAQVVDNTISLPIDKEEIRKYLTVNDKCKLKWIGPFDCLRMLMKELTNSESKWSSPGGHCKQLDINDLVVRWYSDTNSLTLKGKLSENFITELRNIASKEVAEDGIDDVTKDATYADSSEVTARLSDGGIINADLEGIKLDMTILESRLLNAVAENDYKSDIDFLKIKVTELEGVVQNQDEVIHYLNKENTYFKSKLLFLEKLVLNMPKDLLNKDGSPNSVITIEEKSPANNCNCPNFIDSEQCINENSPCGNNNLTVDIPESGAKNENGNTFPFLVNQIVETLSECQQNLAKISKKIDAAQTPNQSNYEPNDQLGNRISGSEQIPKHQVPCPFLRRRGHCLKGSNCDFSHYVKCPNPYPFQRVPPTTSYPIFHPYPKFYPPPLMEIPTRPPLLRVPPPSHFTKPLLLPAPPLSHFPSHLNFPRFQPLSRMASPPWPPLPTAPPIHH